MRRLMIVFFIKALLATIEKGNIISAFLSLTLFYFSYTSQFIVIGAKKLRMLYCRLLLLHQMIPFFYPFFLFFFSLLSVLLALLLFLYYYDQFKFSSSLHHRQFFPSSSATIIHQSVHNQRHRVDRQARIFRRFGVKRRKAFVDHHA